MDLLEDETIVTTATYRGVTIYATSKGYCIVEYVSYYRCDSLGAAKTMIDDLKCVQRN